METSSNLESLSNVVSPSNEESPSNEGSPINEESPSNDLSNKESPSNVESPSSEMTQSKEISPSSEDNDDSEVSDNEDFLLKDQYDPYNYNTNKIVHRNENLPSKARNLASSIQEEVNNEINKLDKDLFSDCKICKKASITK